MQSFSTYIMGITAVAIIGGILTKLLGQKQGSGKLIFVLCGMFLTITILQPFTGLMKSPISWTSFDLSSTAEELSMQGKTMTQAALREVITENSEAYILSKANEMGLNIIVAVSLSQDDVPVPVSVQLKGAISPLEKTRLTTIIANDLGIPKEEQRWSQ